MMGAPELWQPFCSSFALAFVLAAALVPLCRLLARRTGVVAQPRDDRWHRDDGAAARRRRRSRCRCLIGTLVTGVAREIIVPLVCRHRSSSSSGWSTTCCRSSRRPSWSRRSRWRRLLVFLGYRLNWLESRLLDSLLTLVWVVGLTNAFNLLDNMDGLCAGIALIVAALLIAGLIDRRHASDWPAPR